MRQLSPTNMKALKDHSRFPYSPIYSRPEGSWPNGARVAFYIGLNLEHFSFGEGLGGQLVPGSNTENSADILNYSWREYGNRVGGFRLLSILDKYKLPCSVLINGAVAAHAPELVRAHVDRGDEIVGHGWTNSEKQGDMDEETEGEMIDRTTKALTFDEIRPKGWLGPWISQSKTTPDLLQEKGYTYLLDWCHDDAPVYMKTRGGHKILSVPYPQELNDIPTIMVRRASSEEFAQMIIDNLDEMIDQAEEAGPPLVMGLALHPYIIGQPFRLKSLRKALQHVCNRRDRVWITTAGKIAQAFSEKTVDDDNTKPEPYCTQDYPAPKIPS